MTSLSSIQEFLGRKRFAIIGVSRNAKDLSRSLFHDLRSRGYDVVPVNPNLSDVEGVHCFASIREVPQPIEGALLMTNSAATEDVVKQCASAGVHQVWMYRAGGCGAVNSDAVRFCQENGVRVIEGECPYMFLSGAGLPHRIHGFCRKLLGRYPS